MKDERIEIVTAKFPDDFTKAVNALLNTGNWRVAETEMSVTDHHYFALLIKAASD